MNTPADDLVLQLARDQGLLRAEQIDAAHALSAAHQNAATPAPGLVEVLISTGALRERQVAEILAAEFGFETADVSAVQISPEVLALVPRMLAFRYQLLPLLRTGHTLRVAISDPTNSDGVDIVAHLLGLAVDPVVATAREISAALAHFYGLDSRDADELSATLSDAANTGSTLSAPLSIRPRELGTESADDAPIIKLVEGIIQEAVRRRASDIHLEPLEKQFRVRYRIDGALIEVENPPKRLQLAVISRVKLMANISIAEKRVPQDGRIQIVIADRPTDLRVSSLPTAHGESIVMRILDQRGLQLGLPELGFFKDDQIAFERAIASPDGIVLVTGPTGSGKTTTLYSCLHHINTPARKIITVEDPVEYQLSGVNQVPVRHEVGMTFASALRAMLRQAPNIVMIGEIRDLETAEIAITAALTGHLVFSTLHTNDAPGAVTRLIDIGVKPFRIAAALRTVVAQRLVRKTCQNCRRACVPPEHQLRALKLESLSSTETSYMQGTGCAACNATGYRGRIGIFEAFFSNEEIQRMIYEGAGAAQLRQKARSLGMRTMREDGARKATAGLTTVEEVVSITVGDAN